MLKLIIVVFILTGLWWWLIGNKTLQDSESETEQPIQWSNLVSEAKDLGNTANANQCLVESMLKSRLCQANDSACSNDIAIYASACLESTADYQHWCSLLPLKGSAQFQTWPSQACTQMNLTSASCREVTAHILELCAVTSPDRSE